ncbi:hypothetical protein LTR37_018442 [Vermiconidia calcicola]|uniref:Uncharacterized protein n=1 Tax=Vermiconidia calcicola TaxID=1690605 RepID=A0ACC3MIR4_9PEZI|nr:hypothetical protein LTR37_018442 [Vermiconidia calcicola]
MADPRALLRASRAARRITHPHASYTSDGKLSCNLCESVVKGEGQWQAHLHSTGHTLRSQRAQEAKAARDSSNNGLGSRKRKAESLDSPAAAGEGKRVRSTDPAVENQEDTEDDAAVANQITGADVRNVQEEAVTTDTAPPAQQPTTKDDEEFAAFEREIAALEQQPLAEPASSVFNSTATISAAPLTAEQLAAQAREEASTQRGKRDVELEEEREDVARAMQDEFEEMEGLEERVRRLRERREALRKASEGEAERVGADTGGEAEGIGDASNPGEDEPSEDEDEDEEDEWRFGGT